MYLAKSDKIKERNNKIRVLVWNEFQHEKTQEAVKKIYPDGMHGYRGAQGQHDMAADAAFWTKHLKLNN